jgi:hypothetical protein
MATLHKAVRLGPILVPGLHRTRCAGLPTVSSLGPRSLTVTGTAARLRAPPRRRRALPRVMAANGKPPAQRPNASRDEEEESGAFLAGFGPSNALFAACWAALSTYAFLWSPNQTPFRDSVYLEKLVGLGGADGVIVNTVFFCLFNIMGVWPAVYAALLTPSGRSSNGVPSWPFITGSFALGAFALLPYFALWSQPKEVPELPTADEMQTGSPLMKALESRLAAALLGVATCGLVFTAATAGAPAWAEYGKLFQESRFIHITSVDFLTLTLLAPFWVFNDAEARRWDSPLLPLLACVPLLGPVIYLNLRPRAE